MDKSIFSDKSLKPDDIQLKEAIGDTFPFWQKIKEYTYLKYPAATEEWNFSGEKYGWSFRIKDKKRAIVYLLPRDKYFKVAFVFGQKASDIIFNSQISGNIKQELESARVYAEGRGIRIDIKDETKLKDILTLIEVKVGN